MLTAFTAVSAVCVTGLVVVDTGTYWSTFGRVVIMALFQLGGFGMMTLATLLGLLVNRSFRLRAKLIAQAESRTGAGRHQQRGETGAGRHAGDGAGGHAAADPAPASVVRAWLGRGRLSGLFHSVSAFNNAGFSIHVDGLVRYATDGFILLPVMSASLSAVSASRSQRPAPQVVGPAALVVARKLTLSGTAVLLVGGFMAVLLFEWSNPGTLGPMAWADKLLSAAFVSVSARTAGFNALDIGALTHESWRCTIS